MNNLSLPGIVHVGRGVDAIRFRQVTPEDYETVCGWVNEGTELQLVGSEDGLALTPSILDRWVSSACCAVIFEIGGVPIVFGTGSANEWPLPSKLVEAGHFIVSPDVRRRYHGSTFLRILTRILLSGYNYRGVIARIVPTNAPALAVMQYLRWNEISEARAWTENTPFRWFSAPEGEPQ